MGMAPEEVLESGCVGDEFEEDVDLSLVLKAIPHPNHSWMLQFTQYFYFPEDSSPLGWLYKFILLIYFNCKILATLSLPT